MEVDFDGKLLLQLPLLFLYHRAPHLLHSTPTATFDEPLVDMPSSWVQD